MKIAFVNTEFLPVPPVKGGAVEEWIESAASMLKEHEISIFSIDEESQKRESAQDHKTYFHYKRGLLGKILLSTYKLPFKNPSSRYYFLPYALWSALKIKKIQADIIHIHNRPQFVWIMRTMNPRSKIILHIHQLSVLKEKGVWTDELISHIDFFVGCSQFIVDEIRKLIGDKKKAVVVYNALDISQFPSVWQNPSLRDQARKKIGLGNEKMVLFAGRLAENKGVHWLIEAVRDLISQGQKDLRLYICGARGYANREVTPYIQRLYDLAKPVSESIHFVGFVPHDEMVNYYLASDLVVIPSEVAEGFGIVAIESMACGIAVVASGRGGLKEIIADGASGFLVEHPNTEGFKKQIRAFLSHPSQFAKIGQAGRLRVEKKFTWDHVTNDLLNVYKECLSHG